MRSNADWKSPVRLPRKRSCYNRMQRRQPPLAAKEEPPVREMQPSFSSLPSGRAERDPVPWENWYLIDSLIEHSRLVFVIALQHFLVLRRSQFWRRDPTVLGHEANQRRSYALHP